MEIFGLILHYLSGKEAYPLDVLLALEAYGPASKLGLTSSHFFQRGLDI